MLKCPSRPQVDIKGFTDIFCEELSCEVLGWADELKSNIPGSQVESPMFSLPGELYSPDNFDTFKKTLATKGLGRLVG